MSEDLNIRRLQAEVDYLNYKIDKYTGMIVDEAFTGKDKALMESHIAKMLSKKLENSMILDVMKHYE